MTGIPLQKRPFDLFVSFSDADREHVEPIVELFTRHVGLKVRFDATRGPAAHRATERLDDGICSSRGALFFLSPSWLASTGCKDEHDAALSERREDDQFLVVGVQIADCELPDWFQIANVLDFRDRSHPAIADLLRSLSPNPQTRLDAKQDVYLSAPWSRPTAATDKVVKSIAAMGWRLVGDSPSLPHFEQAEERIESIINTSRGAIIVLPYYASKGPALTSQFILDEARIAQRCGKAYLLFAEPGVNVPQELIDGSLTNELIRIGEDGDEQSTGNALHELDNHLERTVYRDTGTYVFLATSLLNQEKETEQLIAVIENASNMRCIQGHNLPGQNVQQAIIDRISGAALVIADVTDNHMNTMIEAGIAMGAGTELHLICRLPDDGSRQRRFMFQHKEMNWYSTPAERMAEAYRIAKPYRRRIYFPA